MSLSLVLALVPGMSLPHRSAAQDMPRFRVDSKQVLVIVDPGDFSGKDIENLTAKDFHLFEDGKEQKIRVADSHLNIRRFSDNNRSFIDEYSYYSTRGKWTAESGALRLRSDHFYVLAYTPPPSPPGSCHQIKVKASHRVWFLFVALREYCNTEHSTYDTFNGTALDRKMQEYAASGRTGDVPLSGETSVFYATPNAVRADIVLELPPGMEMETKDNEPDIGIQILGLVYRKDGSIAARFSDKHECFAMTWLGQDEWSLAFATALCKTISPFRYEIQLELAAGDYEIQAVVSNGNNFGIVKIPLQIENFDGKQLAISSIALCRLRHAYEGSTSDARSPNKSGPIQEMLFPTSMIPLVSKGIEFSPTADTRLQKTDPLLAYFEVYEPLLASRTPPKVEVHLRIVDSNAGTVRDDFQPVDLASYIEPGSLTMHISRKIPLDKLGPGSYRLEVQAIDSAGGSTKWQSARFSVD